MEFPGMVAAVVVVVPLLLLAAKLDRSAPGRGIGQQGREEIAITPNIVCWRFENNWENIYKAKSRIERKEKALETENPFVLRRRRDRELVSLSSRKAQTSVRYQSVMAEQTAKDREWETYGGPDGGIKRQMFARANILTGSSNIDEESLWSPSNEG
ncbi:hypothetical protein GWI33_014833 [Rhynchophorus ferrugineus]|uniref:Uncharacterized protein n=1 Tax=Rhynchophorus ferrugineus TaxID=354439 RepID=A0A834I6A9_RHYFE|nr:hypothetical protein GWI33_014833 [Rhynchophorus ferrugineus]